MHDDGERAFAVRVVALGPGCERIYDESEWRDAIVCVGCGEIELECLGGTRRFFRRGDILWLAGLPLRAVRNTGTEPVLLVTVSRRQDDRG
jgi:hypothetical protein